MRIIAFGGLCWGPSILGNHEGFGTNGLHMNSWNTGLYDATWGIVKIMVPF